jgi:glycosyltransferase involved in cell wall biosynthesis
MTPTVTAVIPCFNHGAFLAECLDSLRAQTVATWRAIVVDDASTDGTTPQLCDAQADDRVQIMHLATNLGRALVRNHGIALAQTEAVLNLDADDTLHPQFFEKTVPPLLADPQIGVVYTDYRIFGAWQGKRVAEPFDVARLYQEQYIGGAALFRRSAWAKTHGYHEDFSIGNEDYDFWLSVVEAGYRGVYVPEQLYNYRMHKTSWSATTAGGDDRVFRSRHALLQHHRAGFEAHGAVHDFEVATYRNEARRLAKAGRRGPARAMWREVLERDPQNWRARLGLVWP